MDVQTRTIECPSGMVITVREFQVRDKNLLAKSSKASSSRRGNVTAALLDAITISLDDPGPVYDFGSRDKPNWSKVLQGDSQVVVLENRIATWGTEYLARVKCSDPACGERFQFDVDLSTIKIKPLPESSHSHVKSGAPLSCVLPRTGKRIEFRLLRGEDEKALSKIQRDYEDTMSSSYLRLRVTGIEGVQATEWHSWLEVLNGYDSEFLQAAFDEADCGADQAMQLVCPECGNEWVDDVRLDRDFLFPRYRRKTMT